MKKRTNRLIEQKIGKLRNVNIGFAFAIALPTVFS